MKDFYLNELSLEKADSIADAHNAIRNFVYSVVSLRTYGFNVLRKTENLILNNIEIASEYFIYQWRSNENVSRELRQRFRSIVTQGPVIDENDAVLLEKATKTDVYYKDKPVLSLTAAFNAGSVVVSFIFNSKWDSPFITSSLIEIEGTDLKTTEVTIKSIAKIGHCIKHIDWIKSSVKHLDFHHSDPLPYKIVSNFLSDLEDKSFYPNNAYLSDDERISVYNAVSKNIALLNFYTPNNQLSKKNSDRQVFQSPNRDVYLALDKQHGRFECCNHKGKHQGEFDFYGTQTKEADKNGGHDIKL